MRSPLIILCCAIGAFTSCSKDENLPKTHKSYNVSINICAEVNTSFPESKGTTSDDIYGIAFYAKNKDQPDASYSPCAYGYFDDLSKVSITMYDNYKYKTALTYIQNAKSLLKKTTKEEYYGPFEVYDQTPVTIQNKIAYNGVKYLPSANSTDMANGTRYERAPIDRFYGETEDFIPSKDNKTISITAKRVSYGINFIVKGLTDGNLKITLNGSPDVIINANSNGSSLPQQKVILCTTNITDAYNFSESGTSCYSDLIQTTITWNRDSGDQFLLFTGQLTAQRNKIAIVTINVKDPSLYGAISITGLDEQFQNGNSYTIDNKLITQNQ